MVGLLQTAKATERPSVKAIGYGLMSSATQNSNVEKLSNFAGDVLKEKLAHFICGEMSRMHAYELRTSWRAIRDFMRTAPSILLRLRQS